MIIYGDPDRPHLAHRADNGLNYDSVSSHLPSALVTQKHTISNSLSEKSGKFFISQVIAKSKTSVYVAVSKQTTQLLFSLHESTLNRIMFNQLRKSSILQPPNGRKLRKTALVLNYTGSYCSNIVAATFSENS